MKLYAESGDPFALSIIIIDWESQTKKKQELSAGEFVHGLFQKLFGR